VGDENDRIGADASQGVGFATVQRVKHNLINLTREEPLASSSYDSIGKFFIAEVNTKRGPVRRDRVCDYYCPLPQHVPALPVSTCVNPLQAFFVLIRVPLPMCCLYK
jgi:hypothetical protein